MEQKTYRRGRFHKTSVMNEDFGNEYSQDYDTKNPTKKGNFESAQNPDYTEFNENYKKLLCNIEGWMTRLMIMLILLPKNVRVSQVYSK